MKRRFRLGVFLAMGLIFVLNSQVVATSNMKNVDEASVEFGEYVVNTSKFYGSWRYGSNNGKIAFGFYVSNDSLVGELTYVSNSRSDPVGPLKDVRIENNVLMFTTKTRARYELNLVKEGGKKGWLVGEAIRGPLRFDIELGPRG